MRCPPARYAWWARTVSAVFRCLPFSYLPSLLEAKLQRRPSLRRFPIQFKTVCQEHEQGFQFHGKPRAGVCILESITTPLVREVNRSAGIVAASAETQMGQPGGNSSGQPPNWWASPKNWDPDP